MDRMTPVIAWTMLEEINRLYTLIHPVALTQQMYDELENDIERWKLILEDAGYCLVFSDSIRRYVFAHTSVAETPGEIASLETVPELPVVKPATAMHELEELVEQRREYEAKYQKVVKQLALMSQQERRHTLERLNAIWGGK